MATISLVVDSTKARSGAKQYRDAMGRDVVKPSRQADKSVRRVEKSFGSLEKAGGGLKRALAGAFAGFTAVSAIRSATGVIAGFEETLATLEGVTGLDRTSDQFQALTDRARELGATTRFSAQESAEGLLFLSRAGFSADESLAAIGATLNLASAGALELGEAADFASNIVAQFGLGADKTERIVDTLVNTANSANTDVRQLAEALKFAGPVAGALGRSAEETAAALGVLGDSGVQASLAGTNLRGILLALESPTSDAAKTIKGLGLSIDDLAPSANSISSIFDRFREAGLDAAEASAIFGRRSAGAALILAKSTKDVVDGTNRIEELTKANLDSAGTAERNAKLIDNTLAGAFRTLKSAVEEAFLTLGDSGFLKVLRESVDVLTEVVRILTGAEGAYEKASRSAQLLSTFIKAGTVALGSFLALNAAVKILGIGQSVLKAAGAFKALAAVIAANPIGAIAVAIGIVIGLLIEFQDETVTIGDSTATVGDFIAGLWEALGDRFKALTTFIGNAWRELSTFFGDIWTGIVDFIKTNFEALTEFLGVDWESVIDFLVDLAKFFANTTIAIFKSVGDVIGNIVSAFVEAGQAIAEFDITDPIGSIENVLSKLNPARIAALIGKDVGANFGRDFVGEVINAVERVAPEVNKKFKELSEQDEFGLEDFTILGLPRLLDDARENAVRRRQEREERGEGSDAAEKAREAEEALQKAQAAAAGLNVELGEIPTLGLDEATGAANRNADAIKGARDQLNELFGELELEQSLIGLTNDERERAVALLEVEALARAAQVEDIDAVVDAYGRLFDKVREGQAAANDLEKSFEEILEDTFSAEALDQVATNIGDAFAGAFGDVIRGAKDLEDVFEDLARNLSDIFLEAFVLDPIKQIFSSLARSALGSVFNFSFADGGVISGTGQVLSGGGRGAVTAFQSGGVVTSPEFFPLAGGRTGLRGEAGPEAILPLTTDSRGRLGVSAVGEGETSGNFVDNRTFNTRIILPNVRDARGFESSRRQVAENFRRVSGGGRG